MAIIYSYPDKSSPSLSDKIIITDVESTPANQTKRCTIQGLADAISGQFTLQEVLQAHIGRFPTNGQLGKPQQLLIAIQEELQTEDFGIIFQEFNKKAGVYGFGDLQVKQMWEELNSPILNT